LIESDEPVETRLKSTT